MSKPAAGTMLNRRRALPARTEDNRRPCVPESTPLLRTLALLAAVRALLAT
jgi:hypothetical protein